MSVTKQQEPKYEGWGAFGPDSIKGNFKWFEYEPKTFCDDDIECRFGIASLSSCLIHPLSTRQR